MKISLSKLEDGVWSDAISTGTCASSEQPSLSLLFADRHLLEQESVIDAARNHYPNAQLICCSTSGEIYQESVLDHTAVLTNICFERTIFRTFSVDVRKFGNSFEAGQSIAREIPQEELTYVLVISDGGLVNGTDLIEGMNSVFSDNVLITGGLAGDADRFEKTLVGLNGDPEPGTIVAVAFYGDAIQVKHNSMGGWEMFGPERIVTRSEANVLHEIDGVNALELYKRYLGDYAANLPSSALLFPLSLETSSEDVSTVVRTILTINNDEGTMTFAGNVPVGGKVRFMKANFDKLVDAAGEAANGLYTQGEDEPELAILISCVGRKLILKERIEEEVEAVRAALPRSTVIMGFYSYGELSPMTDNGKCALHNQTMTITTLRERL